MPDIQNSNSIVEVAAPVAKQMLKDNILQEQMFEVPGTQIRLFLVRADGERASQLNAIPGAFLGISFPCDDKEFLIFRKNK